MNNNSWGFQTYLHVHVMYKVLISLLQLQISTAPRDDSKLYLSPFGINSRYSGASPAGGSST